MAFIIATMFCTLSNLFERHVQDSFYKFLQNNGLLYLAQSGFHALYSCETALTKIIVNWTSNMEKGLLNWVVLIDLRKAFDLVATDLLLHKLSLYQCDDLTINCTPNNLSCRAENSTCVIFKGNLSKTNTVNHGVPQGSILGSPLIHYFYE